MTAKLHHYVPQMLLRRFSADPAAENPPIYTLDKKTGAPRRNSVRNVAAISHYNRLEKVPGLDAAEVEKMLAEVEALAAEPLQKIVDREPLSPQEQINVAAFVYCQHHRTPRARTWATDTQEQSAIQLRSAQPLDPARVQRFYASRGKTLSREEAEEWSRLALDEMRRGRITAKMGHDAEVLGMFLVADEVVPRLCSDMTWATVTMDEPSFVLPDHPVAILDPSVPEGRGVSWFSSPNVQITLPVDPRTVLMLWPGPPTQGSIEADDDMVLDLNLRAHASAEWSLFGPSQGLVQQVRSNARRNKRWLAELRPRPPVLVVQEHKRAQTGPFRQRVIAPTESPRRRRRA